MSFFDSSLIQAQIIEGLWQSPSIVEHTSSYLFMAGRSPNPLPIRNYALRLTNDLSPLLFLKMAELFFKKVNRSFTLIVDSSDLELIDAIAISKNIKFLSSAQRMKKLIENENYNNLSDLVDFTIKNSFNVNHLISIYKSSYDYSENELALSFPKTMNLNNQSIDASIGYKGNEPVTANILIETGKTHELVWVGTKKNFQKKGFCLTLLTKTINNSHLFGREIFLTSSYNTEKFYEKLGFKKEYQIKFYLFHV